MKKRSATAECSGEVSDNSTHRPVAATYKGLNFGRDELHAIMRKTYDELINFVTTPVFKVFHKELMSLLPRDRPAFVAKVLFDPDERVKRGMVIPDGILIEASAFGDRRPTLFAVKKLLPLKYQSVWENLNLTFDNEYKNQKVSRAPEKAWRPPLPVALQNALIAADADLESVPAERGVSFGMYAVSESGRLKTPSSGCDPSRMSAGNKDC